MAQAEAAGVLDGSRQDSSAPAVQERFAELCAIADAGNEAAKEIIRPVRRARGPCGSAVTNALDVDRVVFGGPFWTCLSAAYLEQIPGLVERTAPPGRSTAIEVVGTGVGEDVGAVGAACLVLEHTLAPRSQRLLLEG